MRVRGLLVMVAAFAAVFVGLMVVIGRITAAPTAPTATSQIARATATSRPSATQPPAPPLQVNAPVMQAPTNGLANVRAYYSEAYTEDIFTVRWRPGAFPPERATQVAAAARTALDHDNQLLGTDNNDPMEIILADTLFNEECNGCQGFAAADLRQVFILQDGSVAPDEFQLLLTHEIGHVLAYDYIADPTSLFFAEGFASWVMKDPMVDAGYLPPQQTAAWAMKVGQLPSLDELRVATYSGRVRARDEYDGAESFTQFMVETYGLPAYEGLYKAVALDPQATPERFTGKDWAAIEQEWHGWLQRWADTTVGDVGATQWFAVFQQVRAGFQRLYDDPSAVRGEQYANLAASRVALNRGDLPSAIAYINASDLGAGTAN